VPPAPPEGNVEPPVDGALPPEVVAGVRRTAFGIYLHVPFCTARCGYCDFNTYTAAELAGGVTPARYPQLVAAELDLAARALPGAGPVATVFFGGGTPSLLQPEQVGGLLRRIAGAFGLAGDAEVTLEANPETLDERRAAGFAAAGVTRVSLGMQSAVGRVLRVLDRVHTPGRAVAAAAECRRAGIGQVSLDLIYGTPGETAADWAASVEAALGAEPDHLSAYALTVEPGTRLAGRVRRGELAPPDDDELAERYEAVDAACAAAGYAWYEVSNWARRPEARCRHNLGYWRGDGWWGLGPGAHSHVGGVRWWNVRHPSGYAARVRAGRSPAAGREVLDEPARRLERILLEIRLAEGLPAGALSPVGAAGADRLVADGLLTRSGADRLVLTRAGRLLADAVVRAVSD
jgi:putative oxygen-independent coproporphyrinogen III oxidase